MRKFTLSLCIAAAFFVLPLTLSAQTDSSRYDIGHITLNKNFTQHVTIRGEDLEKMPFVNLSEAIRVWLFGAYTGPLTVAYVVDGNPVTDVDIYPIYDIEEVTFINNAAAGAAYGNGQQELVMVTTRRGSRSNWMRGSGSSGMRVTAQTGLVEGNGATSDTHAGVYHQYYARAGHQAEKLSFGVSAGWQRDVEPPATNPTSVKVDPPNNLQRWRLNGWLDWRPDAQNTIGLRMGYGPQRIGYGYASTGVVPGFSYSYTSQTHVLVPEFSWEGHWLAGLRNKFTAVYLSSASDDRYAVVDSMISGTINQYTSTDNTGKTRRFLFADRLDYDIKAGIWHIVPAVDIRYQHIDEESRSFSYQQSTTVSASEFNSEGKAGVLYGTPAVDVTLRQALDISAGAMINASTKIEPGSSRIFPFVTAALDLLHLKGSSGGSSLKLFGSYARRPGMYIDDYSLGDFSVPGGSQSLFTILHNAIGYMYYNGQVSNTSYAIQEEPGYWTWETGATYASSNGRVTLQYSYERRKLAFLYFNGNLTGFITSMQDFHHADVRFRVVDSKTASWMTGINVSLLRGSVAGPLLSNAGGPVQEGDVDPGAYSWTGGWVNRLRLGHFSAGLDLFYHFGETQVNFNTGTSYKLDSHMAPNIYAGYNWHAGRGTLEVFAEASGLLRNNSSDLSDNRKYYTIGGSYSL